MPIILDGNGNENTIPDASLERAARINEDLSGILEQVSNRESAGYSVETTKFEDALKKIGDKDFKVEDIKLDTDSALSKSAKRAVDRAQGGHGTLEDGSFEHTRGSTTVSTEKLKELAQEKKDLEEQIKLDKELKYDTSGSEKELLNKNEEIKLEAEKIEGRLQDHASAWKEAGDSVVASETQQAAKINEAVAKAKRSVDEQVRTGGMNKDEAKVLKRQIDDQGRELGKKLKSAHGDFKELRAESARNLKSTIREVESEAGVKLKINEALTNVSQDITKAGGELSTMEKLWSKNSTGGKAISGLGALAVLHGGYKIISPDVNPETGKSEISGGNVAEAGAGMLALISQVMSNKGVQAAVRAV